MGFDVVGEIVVGEIVTVGVAPLRGDRALLGSGAKVTVTGHTEPDGMSVCQQGIHLNVETVTPSG